MTAGPTERTSDPASGLRGRNTITARALNRLASAVTADELGVSARDVRVDLDDDHGALALRVSTPIRVVPLSRVQADESVVVRTGGSLLERAGRAQESIRERFTEISGSEVAHVTTRLTAVDIRREGRVR